MRSPETALIVDDEKHLRLYLRLILSQLGLTTIVEASNGREGIERYKAVKPDLVLMDVNMPVVEGIEALRGIVDLDADAVVVMVSSMATRQVVEDSVKQGATYYIRKDSSKDEIIQIIRNLIQDIWGIQALDS
ncbi:MAG: response regulator [Opitutales bacterium]|jgi:two-component system chemotaxis response regulator CheY